MRALAKKLDLEKFIEEFEDYFSLNNSNFYDINIHILEPLILDFKMLRFNPPPKIKYIEYFKLNKQIHFNISELYELVKIIRYCQYLTDIESINYPNAHEFIHQIKLDNLMFLHEIFNDVGEIKTGLFPKLDQINIHINHIKEHIQKSLKKSMRQASFYLASPNIHFYDSRECLLLNAGFSKAIKAKVIGRSQGGLFYAIPLNTLNLYEHLEHEINKKREFYFHIEQDLCLNLKEYLSDILNLQSHFNTLDHIQSRVFFHKDNNFNFANISNIFILNNFYHPIFYNHPAAVPINLTYDKDILVLTGLNAGGKTMLLKSILSASFLASLLIPFKINHTSKVKIFKCIDLIINDPQNSINDISTFAGRIIALNNIIDMKENNILLGIDEIELGTDALEAGALFSALLEFLIKRGLNIILTTHHKRLASMIDKALNAKLISALYDEENNKPTFYFLEDSIGKSYALEVALKYGIPKEIIKVAKEKYQEEEINHSREEEFNIKQELLKEKLMLEEEKTKLTKERNELIVLKEHLKKEEINNKNNLDREYRKAINLIKSSKSMQELHKNININASNLSKLDMPNHDIKQDIKEHKSISLHELKSKLQNKNNKIDNKNKITAINFNKKSSTPISKNLCGMRVEKALEELEQYISDSLLAGYTHINIVVGYGILFKACKEFLQHRVKGFIRNKSSIEIEL